MPADADLVEVLACPRCDQPLTANDAALVCPGCRTAFPDLDGVPFLFAHPDFSLAEWRERLDFLIKKLSHDAAVAKSEAEQPSRDALARARLTSLAHAYHAHAEQLRRLLRPLNRDTPQASFETHLALRTRLPSDQGLTSYYANVHRDWFWGEVENRASLGMLREALAGTAAGRTLVLGAGAGRLAYDWHQSGATDMTVTLDFNPLLALTAARLVAGHSVELHEFPIAPRAINDVAIARTLRAPEPVRPGFHIVLGSAMRAPFKRGGFDILITPWLVDILPEPLPVQAARYNALLKTGGRWLWFGSHAFRHASQAANVSLEESVEIIANAGFETPVVRESEMPYMSSPASRHGRREQVVTIVATKKRGVAKAPRHLTLPDWLVTGQQPVPVSEAFKVQALSTRIHAFIMAMIDGQRSIEDMAALLEEQRLMPRDEAVAAVRNFLTKMVEDAQRYAGL